MRRHSRQGQPPSPQRQSRKRHRALCSVAMTLSVVTLGACSSSADTVAARHDAVQHSLDALVSEDGLPAAPRKHPRPKRQLPQLHRRSR